MKSLYEEMGGNGYFKQGMGISLWCKRRADVNYLYYHS